MKINLMGMIVNILLVSALRCYEPQPNVCGDYWTKETEECDDGNLADGDGCSGQCTVEIESYEPNETIETASTISLDTEISALLSSESDIDYYRFLSSAQDIISISFQNCSSDLRLQIFEEITMLEPATYFPPASYNSECNPVFLYSASLKSYLVKVFSSGNFFGDFAPYILNINIYTTPSLEINTAFQDYTAIGTIYFPLDVTAGTSYTVYWADNSDGPTSYTADVLVSAFYGAGEIPIFTNIDNGFTYGSSFIATETGRVIIKINPYYKSGSFALTVSSP